MFFIARFWVIFFIVCIFVQATRCKDPCAQGIAQHNFSTSTGNTINVSTMFTPVANGQQFFLNAFQPSVVNSLSGLSTNFQASSSGNILDRGCYCLSVAPSQNLTIASAGIMSTAPSLKASGSSVGQGVAMTSDTPGANTSGYLSVSAITSPLNSIGMELCTQNQPTSAYPMVVFSKLQLTTGEVLALHVATLDSGADMPESDENGNGYGFFAITSSTPFTEMTVGFENANSEHNDTENNSNNANKNTNNLLAGSSNVFAGGTLSLSSLDSLITTPELPQDQWVVLSENPPAYSAVATLPLGQQGQAAQEVMASDTAQALWSHDMAHLNFTLNSMMAIIANDTNRLPHKAFGKNDVPCPNGYRFWALPIGMDQANIYWNQGALGIWIGADKIISPYWSGGFIGAWQTTKSTLKNIQPIRTHARYFGGRLTACMSDKPWYPKLQNWIIFSKTTTTHAREIPIFQAQANQAYDSWSMYWISQISGTIPLANTMELRPHGMISCVANGGKSFYETMTPLVSGGQITEQNALLNQSLALQWDTNYSYFTREEVGVTIKKNSQNKRCVIWASACFGAQQPLNKRTYNIGFFKGKNTFSLTNTQQIYPLYFSPMAGIDYATSFGFSINWGVCLQQSFVVSTLNDPKATWSTWFMVGKTTKAQS